MNKRFLQFDRVVMIFTGPYDKLNNINHINYSNNIKMSDEESEKYKQEVCKIMSGYNLNDVYTRHQHHIHEMARETMLNTIHEKSKTLFENDKYDIGMFPTFENGEKGNVIIMKTKFNEEEQNN